MNLRPLLAPRPQDATHVSALERALHIGTEALLARQDPAGFWVHELEADVTITSEYLLLRRWLGVPDPAREAKAVRHILSLQLADGGWPIYAGGPANISATVKAYFALKMTGLPVTHPHSSRRAGASATWAGSPRSTCSPGSSSPSSARWTGRACRACPWS